MKPPPVLPTKDRVVLVALAKSRGLGADLANHRRRCFGYLDDSGKALRYACAVTMPDAVPETWVSESESIGLEMGKEEARRVAVASGQRVVAKAASALSCLEWVSRNIAVTEPDYGTAPGSAAIAMLNWAKNNPSCESEFWRAYISRIPKESKADEGNGLRDEVASIDRLMGSLGDADV